MTNDLAVTLAARYRRVERMVSRRIGSRLVLVPVAADVAEVDFLYTLNGVAAFLWERFDGESDGHAQVAAVVARFEVDPERAERDYLAFVTDLLEIGALRRET